MGQRIDMSEAEVAVLTMICATTTATMCATLVAHGVPCPATVRESISKSIAVSLTDSFLSGRLSLAKFN